LTKYEDWKAFTKIFMKATKKKREKLPKNSSNKNLTQSSFFGDLIYFLILFKIHFGVLLG
ncbi:hypothetical protein ACOSZF_21860, partial [Cytobacillus firmus]|uniref:hypothetical protein n=1 Tax=Cytobacillus firmus TaxID=1399 RepID=UPI003BA1E365